MTLQDLIADKDFLQDIVNASLFTINYSSIADRNDAKINLLKIHLNGLQIALNKRNLELKINKNE